MHPALEVPEILCLIFKCGVIKCDLSNCARVCRLWATWAVDVLWRTHRVPLKQALRVLTSVTNRTNTDERQNPAFAVVDIGDIDEHEWRRFLAHSSKVYRIGIDCGVSRASLARIKLAGQTFGGRPFGQLQTLKMEIRDGDHEIIHFLALPSLTRVYLRCENFSEGSLAWVNNGLPGAAPNITHFGFMSFNAQGSKLDVSRYSALQYIEAFVEVIWPSFWKSLSSCPILTKVLLTMGSSGIAEQAEEWRMDYVHFPALSTFKIRTAGSGTAALRLMMLRSRMPMLECLVCQGRAKVALENSVEQHLKTHSPKLDVDTLYRSSDVSDFDSDDF